MILVKFDNQEITQHSFNLSLLTNKSEELVENPIVSFIADHQNENVINLALFDEFDNFANQTNNILLTADNTPDEIDELVQKPIEKSVFFVKDEQLDTLLKTLDDLKSGHFGQSAKALPMFQ